MKSNIDNLFPYLVGSVVERKFSTTSDKSDDNKEYYKKIISSTQLKIENTTKMAISSGGEVCIFLLAEMLNYYKSQPYYPSIRSCFSCGRYADRINEYLSIPTLERVRMLITLLNSSKPRYRDAIIDIIYYFCGVYKSKASMFFEYLSREEKILILHT